MSDEMPPKRKRIRFKTVLYLFLALLVLLAALWLFGPREPANTTLRFDPASIGEDLDAYLENSEANVPEVSSDTAKEIVWAYPQSKARTPLAIVKIHGFSASKGEIRPVPDDVAHETSSNLFYTRLKGHGSTGAAMATATVQDWMDDVAEAVAIGSRIGEKVVLVTVSTGGTLAAIAALHPDLKDKIAGIVFIAPNFHIKSSGSFILTFPFARQLVPLIVGPERGFEPRNELHAKYWTYKYPSTALLPLGASVKKALSLPYQLTKIPALFIFSDADTIVDHAVTRQIYDRWGGDKQMHLVENSDDPNHHVIAGDALSPSTNSEVETVIVDWLKKL